MTIEPYTDDTDIYGEDTDVLASYDVDGGCCGEVDLEPTVWVEDVPAPEWDPQPVEDGYGWTEPVPAVTDSSAVIPAGQPGGPDVVQPALQPTVYPAVAPISATPADTTIFEPTTFQSQGSYGTAVDDNHFGDGSAVFTGTGFSALSTTMSPDPIATFGTDLAPATGPTFAPTAMTISTQPSPMAQVFAQAAQQGDILTAFQAQRVMDSQTRMSSIWVDSLAGY